jgi:hypothetical protein
MDLDHKIADNDRRTPREPLLQVFLRGGRQFGKGQQQILKP